MLTSLISAVLVFAPSGCSLPPASGNPFAPPSHPAFLLAPLASGAELRLAVAKLPPARLLPDICSYAYETSSRSEACRKHIDQGLGYYYSYVWMESARSFETALLHDPDCPVAHMYLSRSLEKWGRGDHTKALKRAQELLPKASHREQMLITSRLQEKGLAAGVGPDERKKKAAATLDEMLTLYGDDQEAWFNRAQLAEGHGSVPFYRALLRINPIHPGASHELVHFFEGIRRPLLGMPFAEAYIASSPGIAHPFHMQAHLATRVGRWEKTSDRSTRAVELQKEYHRVLGVKPSEDHQYSHHLEILSISLVHDGRFDEAKARKADAEASGSKFHTIWFRLYQGARDRGEMDKIVAHFRRTDKPMAAYLAAVAALDRNDPAAAEPELNILRQNQSSRRPNKQAELRYLEVQGWYLCQTGSGAEGLKLLERAVGRTKDDYNHHAWGNGASIMEVWGVAALDAGNATAAEEAFQEALAHDAGSIKGALGMEALCRRLNRSEEADRYAAVARRCWSKAKPEDYEALRNEMIARAAKVKSPEAGQ